jgi:DNA-binding MarR family transcriptional regulator
VSASILECVISDLDGLLADDFESGGASRRLREDAPAGRRTGRGVCVQVLRPFFTNDFEDVRGAVNYPRTSGVNFVYLETKSYSFHGNNPVLPMTTRPSISELPDHLGYWLRLVSNQVSTSFARRLADEDVTVAEWVILRLIYGARGIAPNKLAAATGMTRGAISKIADRLVGKGLVQRSDRPDDGRMQALALSARGKRLVPRLAAMADENDRHFFGVLDSSECEALRAMLEKVASRHGISETPIS